VDGEDRSRTLAAFLEKKVGREKKMGEKVHPGKEMNWKSSEETKEKKKEGEFSLRNFSDATGKRPYRNNGGGKSDGGEKGTAKAGKSSTDKMKGGTGGKIVN